MTPFADANFGIKRNKNEAQGGMPG
jgi:hypothetical protein